MRRSEKEVTDPVKISEIIRMCQVCRLGLCKDNIPYIIPVSFGYDGKCFYFHTALKGKKTDILAINNNVCIEFEAGVNIVAHESNPCDWSFSFQSVVGGGKAMELNSNSEKAVGLQHIMAQYSDKTWDFDNLPLDRLRVWKIELDTITGKQSSDYT